MLDSLEIKNYRNLRHLQIQSLGRVNLIVGKNNSGKTSLLEAVSIYAMGGNIAWISNLLNDRWEDYTRPPDNRSNFWALNLKSLSSLFYNRKTASNFKDIISIGPLKNYLFGEKSANDTSILLGFSYYSHQDEPSQKTNRPIKTKRYSGEFEEYGISKVSDFYDAFQISLKDDSFIIPIETDKPYWYAQQIFEVRDNCQYVKTKGLDSNNNALLWDKITLSDKEQYVINALKIIESRVERINFISDNNINILRRAVVKLSNSPDVLPLQSMGDGLNRVLTIILSMVNAENGYLLIDEFENGIHYSVQKQLWEIIFKLSQDLNIQVFATTHSWDCIEAFAEVLKNDENDKAGKLIRLENKNGDISAVEYSGEEVIQSSKHQIDPR